MRRAGEVVTKAEILDNVWDFAFDGDPNIVEVYIRHLRTQDRRAVRPAADRDDPRRRLPARSRRRLTRCAGWRRSGCASPLAAVLVVGVALVGRRRPGWCARTAASLTHNVETAARLRSQRHRGDDRRRRLPADRSPCPAATRTSCRSSTRSGGVVASSANLAGDAAHQHARSPTPTATRRAPSPASPKATARSASSPGASQTTAGDVHGVRRRQPRAGRTTAPTASSGCSLVGAPAPARCSSASTTWVVTGRALRPVEAIRREVEVIGAEDLHRRVPEPATDDEIGRLARTMNAMLARLEDATDRQRRFVADASHELRSPLTGIRAAARGRPRAPRARRLAGDRARACSTTPSGCSDWSTTCSRSRSPTRPRSTPPTASRSTSTRSSSPKPAACTRSTHARRSTRRAVSGAQVDGNADQLRARRPQPARQRRAPRRVRR